MIRVELPRAPMDTTLPSPSASIVFPNFFPSSVTGVLFHTTTAIWYPSIREQFFQWTSYTAVGDGCYIGIYVAKKLAFCDFVNLSVLKIDLVTTDIKISLSFQWVSYNVLLFIKIVHPLITHCIQKLEARNGKCFFWIFIFNPMILGQIGLLIQKWLGKLVRLRSF